MAALNFGLVAGNSEQSRRLRQLVIGSGHQVKVALLAAELSSGQLLDADNQLDAWLVSLAETQTLSPLLCGELAQLQRPLLVDDADPAADDPQAQWQWQRRMSAKLQTVQAGLAPGASALPDAIWILAASAGGPEAVREFFRHLPAGLAAAFVYVQHINQGFEQALVEMLNRHSAYPAVAAAAGERLRSGTITVVASDHWLEWLESGVAQRVPGPWPGPYQPSIDQLVANLGSRFGRRCGVMIFSGMGADGAVAARLLAQRGGRVWVQEPASCAVDSMPQAVLATGVASECSDPAGLANLLTNLLQAGAGAARTVGEDR